MSAQRGSPMKADVRSSGRAVATAKGRLEVHRPLGLTGRFGLWVWAALIGAGALYELVAYADGSGGEPTLSQVVKAARRAGGVAGLLVLLVGLFGGAVVLALHWGFEVF